MLKPRPIVKKTEPLNNTEKNQPKVSGSSQSTSSGLWGDVSDADMLAMEDVYQEEVSRPPTTADLKRKRVYVKEEPNDDDDDDHYRYRSRANTLDVLQPPSPSPTSVTEIDEFDKECILDVVRQSQLVADSTRRTLDCPDGCSCLTCQTSECNQLLIAFITNHMLNN